MKIKTLSDNLPSIKFNGYSKLRETKSLQKNSFRKKFSEIQCLEIKASSDQNPTYQIQ